MHTRLFKHDIASLSSCCVQPFVVRAGEGLRGDEDPALVAKLVDFIHAESEAMIKAGN